MTEDKENFKEMEEILIQQLKYLNKKVKCLVKELAELKLKRIKSGELDEDPWLDALKDSAEELGVPSTTVEILNTAGIDTSEMSKEDAFSALRRASIILRDLGYERLAARRGDKVVKLWKRRQRPRKK